METSHHSCASSSRRAVSSAPKTMDRSYVSAGPLTGAASVSMAFFGEVFHGLAFIAMWHGPPALIMPVSSALHFRAVEMAWTVQKDDEH